jgi:hypothetical protein
MVHVVLIATCVIALVCDGSHFASAFSTPLQRGCQIRSVASCRSSLPARQSKNLMAMTVEANFINDRSDYSQKSKSPIQQFFSRMPTRLQKFSKIAFPFLVQLSVMVLFSAVCPAFAKPAQKSFSKTASVTVKAPPLWKKILEGWEITLFASCT